MAVKTLLVRSVRAKINDYDMVVGHLDMFSGIPLNPPIASNIKKQSWPTLKKVEGFSKLAQTTVETIWILLHRRRRWLVSLRDAVLCSCYGPFA